MNARVILQPESRDDDLFAKVTIGAAVFFAVFFVGYLLASHPPYDGFGYLIGRDFVNMWMGARAALSGHIHAIFDFPAYSQSLHALFPTLPEHNWSYPPDILLFIWPLGLLPYFPALALWSTLGLFVWLAATFPRRSGSKGQFAFLLLAPAVAIDLFAGQNGLFSGALMVAGLSSLERRPVLAGMFFGLLTMKPQLGLLIPIALVLRGQWRCIAAATATAMALFLITGVVFGFSAWTDYVNLALPTQTRILEAASELMPMMMPSAFMNMRVLGLPAPIASFVQLPFTLAAIAAVVWTFSADRDPHLSRAVLVTACFVATPYVFNYDMVVFSWIIWNLRERFENLWDERLALALWTLPVFVMVLGLCHIPGSALIPAAFLWRLIQLLRRDALQGSASIGAPKPRPSRILSPWRRSLPIPVDCRERPLPRTV